MQGYRLGMIALVGLLVLGWISIMWAQEPQLLVLSELEERIAGELAVTILERNLTRQDLRLVPDERVSGIGRKLAAYSDRPHLQYTFAVIEGEMPPRAFSLPGGHVLVSRALLERICDTDAELAFILGHEIAHSALRHYADYALLDGQQAAYVRNLLQGRSQPLSLFAGDVPMLPENGAALPDAVSSDSRNSNSETAAMIVERILLPYMVKIRQLKEFEADQFGALYAIRAGYDFSGSFWVLRRLRQLYGEDFELEGLDGLMNLDAPAEAPEYPDILERLEQLELFRIKAVEVAKLFPLGRDALDRGDYREAALVFESILSLFPQSRTARIGLGVAYHLQYWDSSPGDDFLLAYPGALELEYTYLLERGPRDVDALRRAIDQYQQVLDVEPGNSYACNNIGVAWAELQQSEEAERALREALRLSERDFTMFNLGLLLVRKSGMVQDSAQQLRVKTEALALMEQYLGQIPHDAVAAEYVKTLHREIAEK